jgi:DNA ligase-1
MTLRRRTFNHRLLAWFSSIGFLSETLAQKNPEVLLARHAPMGINPAGYLVSEKLDGVRALWDGATLRFRSGRVIAAPAWFTAKLPATPLDGELWLGRGKFDALSGAVRRAQPLDAEWQQLRYMLFELPQAQGSFTQRAAQLQSLVQTAGWSQLQVVEQLTVANPAALQAKLKAVTTAGGEGLMLHLASAPVTGGRSDVLLKLKPMQDAEATVLSHIPGKGKYTGMLGALEVRIASGQQFKLGSGFSNTQRQHPPAIGSRVTYRYSDVTPSGKPRFASFLRVHLDD